MNKATIKGDIGFLLGISSIFIIIISYFGLHPLLGKGWNIALALALSAIGLFLAINESKKYKDQVIIAGLIVNPIAIVLSIINLIFL